MCPHSSLPALGNDLLRKIHLVPGRTKARTQMHEEVLGPGTKTFSHRLNGMGCNAQLRTLFPGMNQPNRSLNRINQVNRTAVGDVNAQTNVSAVGQQTRPIQRRVGMEAPGHSAAP